jgi:hypothetical protein
MLEKILKYKRSFIQRVTQCKKYCRKMTNYKPRGWRNRGGTSKSAGGMRSEQANKWLRSLTLDHDSLIYISNKIMDHSCIVLHLSCRKSICSQNYKTFSYRKWNHDCWFSYSVSYHDLIRASYKTLNASKRSMSRRISSKLHRNFLGRKN